MIFILNKPKQIILHRLYLWIFIFLQTFVIASFQFNLQAQSPPEKIDGSADLKTCLEYALKHQPVIRQMQLREEISRRDIGIALSDWLPQIEANASFQQYIKQPVSIFPDFTNPSGPKREITTGVKNTSSVQFSASQVIYNNDVFVAGRTAKFYRLASTQTTRERKIALVVEVSKAFYDVLLSTARLDFLKEDHIRIEKSMKDALSQYENGVSDKIDYRRAMISLNNIKAEISGTDEEIKAKYAYLKELMGYPLDQTITVTYDSLKMIQDAWVDTALGIAYQSRIEYQLLLTRMSLQKATVGYYKWGFLPSLSAFANYNLSYQNDNLSELYSRNFPNSSIGLKLTLPLFEGTRRIQQLKRAKLQFQELALDTINLKSRINTEYEQAMAAYKSNLKTFNASQENARIANEVYNIVKLQYTQGIKSFLEVIVSETDLRTAGINALNTLFRLLSSKLDVEKALGNISINN
jgi:outer membrane protein TolC